MSNQTETTVYNDLRFAITQVGTYREQCFIVSEYNKLADRWEIVDVFHTYDGAIKTVEALTLTWLHTN